MAGDRENRDGRCVRGLPERATQLEPIEAWHREVGDDRVG